MERGRTLPNRLTPLQGFSGGYPGAPSMQCFLQVWVAATHGVLAGLGGALSSAAPPWGDCPQGRTSLAPVSLTDFLRPLLRGRPLGRKTCGWPGALPACRGRSFPLPWQEERRLGCPLALQAQASSGTCSQGCVVPPGHFGKQQGWGRVGRCSVAGRGPLV